MWRFSTPHFGRFAEFFRLWKRQFFDGAEKSTSGGLLPNRPIREFQTPFPMEQKKPIIIIKKKVAGHGGHHGGAWKVAYADFVTAMMALFIVLWLMNTSAKVQEAVAGYFRDPAGAGKLAGTGTGSLGPGQSPPVIELKKEDMKELQQQIEKALKSLPDFDKIKKQVELTVTPEGLRIELLEIRHQHRDPPVGGVLGMRRIAQALVGKTPDLLHLPGVQAFCLH